MTKLTSSSWLQTSAMTSRCLRRLPRQPAAPSHPRCLPCYFHRRPTWSTCRRPGSAEIAPCDRVSKFDYRMYRSSKPKPKPVYGRFRFLMCPLRPSVHPTSIFPVPCRLQQADFLRYWRFFFVKSLYPERPTIIHSFRCIIIITFIHQPVILLHLLWVADDAKCICGHLRLRVCLSVCLSVRDRMPTLLHGHGCNLGSGRGCPLVVRYWADCKRDRLRCYGNITRTRNVSEYMLVLALCLVILYYLH